MKKFIVYTANQDTGYYNIYYTEKESNTISDIIAIVSTEEKAKKLCKDSNELSYHEIIWD